MLCFICFLTVTASSQVLKTTALKAIQTLQHRQHLKNRHRHHQRISHPRISVELHPTISNIETASASVGGVDPDSAGKVNQDAAFHCTSIVGERFLFGGVLDGHGKKGHVLNEFLGSYIPRFLEEKLSNYNESTNMQEILIDTFESAHLAARMDESVPAGRSGTTCVVCIVDTNTNQVYTGNVGDSRAILSVKVYGDGFDWRVVPLSTETTTKRESERLRIEKNEGRIDGVGNVWYGPVGIAMTRALGDVVMKRAGVISTPEVTCFDLNKELNGHDDDFLVRVLIGSDGIFDVLENDEATAFLHDALQVSGGSLEQGCIQLVEEARRKWQGGLPLDVRIDDTSVVSISFQYRK